VAAVAAALLACAPALTACGNDSHPVASESASATTSSAGVAEPAPEAPLPPPEALTDVLYRLADASVPGEQKVALVEGYTPLGFTAENIAWASDPPGNVTSDVTVHSQNPAMSKGFTFPMEFTPAPGGGWQLARTTADILLTFNQNPATPTPMPTPMPTPTG
jgi:hypothetical protein